MTPFWKYRKLHELTEAEWEALCDGCARCCVHKLEDEDTGSIHYTCVACRLLDIGTLRCTDYPNRHRLVPECAALSADRPEPFEWMPETCAYRLMHEGRPLPDWHPLITGDPASVRDHGVAAEAELIPEYLAGDDFSPYVI